ncbi:MAG: hypothetical protein QW666_00525 [Candidatus Woesearchaeota archaeon]
MKKAQITIFIIIGILILVGTGLMIYLFSSKAIKKGSEQAVMQGLRPATVQAVKDYITNCLDVSASMSLELVGKQGGFLYESQGGLIPDPSSVFKGVTYLDYDNLKLAYDIVPPTGKIGDIFSAEPPDYPWPMFPYTTGGIQDYGYFGISKLPPLYREISGSLSIQDQLEKSIASNLLKCTSWSTFEEQGLHIETGAPPIVQMFIAENVTELAVEEYISFVLNWSVMIKEYATGAQTELKQFSVSYPVRFGQIYYTIKSIIDAEISNISYEPNTTASYFITINRDVFKKDDIIVYQDFKAKLKGVPYEWRIARRNRAPALQWINQTRIDKYFYCIGNDVRFNGNQFTFVPLAAVAVASPESTPVSQIFPLIFVAKDPDNDVITFSIDPSASAIDANYWSTWALASYSADQQTGGLKITVTADDKELKDYQVVRFIPIGCPVQ